MISSTVLPFTLEPSWQAVLQDELAKPYLLELATFIEKEYAKGIPPIYPPREHIFNAFLQTPFHQVKVLVIGQDPYHGAGQAHGLSFSVPEGIRQPPSLVNIFKELQSDLNIVPPTHGSLLKWAKQGVMLLNATLTVSQGEPMSHHGRGWEKFTDAVVQKLVNRENPLAFVLWGKSAQDKCRFLREACTPTRHLVLTAAHPSPFSAHHGFFGCRHFSKINEFLIKNGETPIDWAL